MSPTFRKIFNWDGDFEPMPGPIGNCRMEETNMDSYSKLMRHLQRKTHGLSHDEAVKLLKDLRISDQADPEIAPADSGAPPEPQEEGNTTGEADLDADEAAACASGDEHDRNKSLSIASSSGEEDEPSSKKGRVCPLGGCHPVGKVFPGRGTCALKRHLMTEIHGLAAEQACKLLKIPYTEGVGWSKAGCPVLDCSKHDSAFAESHGWRKHVMGHHGWSAEKAKAEQPGKTRGPQVTNTTLACGLSIAWDSMWHRVRLQLPTPRCAKRKAIATIGDNVSNSTTFKTQQSVLTDASSTVSISSVPRVSLSRSAKRCRDHRRGISSSRSKRDTNEANAAVFYGVLDLISLFSRSPGGLSTSGFAFLSTAVAPYHSRVLRTSHHLYRVPWLSDEIGDANTLLVRRCMAALNGVYGVRACPNDPEACGLAVNDVKTDQFERPREMKRLRTL